MSKKPSKPTDDEMRKLLHGLGVPVRGSLDELVKDPWAHGIGLEYPATTDQLRILTEAGFEYDARTQIAWRKARDGGGIER